METFTRETLKTISKRYIFHGSPKLIKELAPHQARCASGKEQNLHNAVYGSSAPEFAIVFAFEKTPTTENLKESGWTVSTPSNKAKPDSPWATLYKMKIEENAKGFLYYFPKEKFSRSSPGSIQLICQESIAPEKVFQINYKDFEYLFKLSDKPFSPTK